MNTEQIHKALKGFENPPKVTEYLETFERICQGGQIGEEASNELVISMTNLIARLPDSDLDKAIPIMETYFKFTDKLRASTKNRQILASCAIDLVSERLDLVNAIEEKLLQEEIIDGFRGTMIAGTMARLGFREKSVKYIVQALAVGEMPESIVMDELINEFYENDSEYRAMVDAVLNNESHQVEATDLPSAIENAHKEMKSFSISTEPRVDPILNILKFVTNDNQAEAESFLILAFKELKEAAKQREELIEEVHFDALVRVAAGIERPKLGDVLANEFSYVTDDREEDGVGRHLGLKKVGGTISLALTALNHKGGVRLLNDFINAAHSRYEGEDFFMKIRYSAWMLAGNGPDALKYIADPEHTKGTGFAACALADLNYKDALATLQKYGPDFANLRADTLKDLINFRALVSLGDIQRSNSACAWFVGIDLSVLNQKFYDFNGSRFDCGDQRGFSNADSLVPICSSFNQDSQNLNLVMLNSKADRCVSRMLEIQIYTPLQ